jgi:hypothetical protein
MNNPVLIHAGRGVDELVRLERLYFIREIENNNMIDCP